MKSNGGVISAREVAEHPITTILSGPAAGALGASALAVAAGYDRVLTADVGGTSTDVCLVERGAPAITTDGAVGRFPIKVPMIDIVTVGSGGGSIARVGRDGGLRVGPESAGADPGPMCYGRTGDQPTATDAHLLLGRVPRSLLGGEIPLDVGAAERGLARLGTAMRLSPTRVAEGILEIAAWNQANAIRQVSIKRGLDPRDYTLVAFGGAGPLLAGRLLDLLNLRAALIPPSPGNVSALGLLVVDLKNDYVQTFVQRHDRLEHARVEEHFRDLEALARAALRAEGFADHEIRVGRSADLRYFGQAWEVRVELPPGSLDERSAAEAVERFHAAHEQRFGYAYRQAAGALASVEAEVEAAIERTSRSPMIREARDFRAGIHDRRCRKLTGRSYSALVQPIVRDFPIETMQPGDVFFHNDVYGSEGGIGHLPDLCVTVPVFDAGDVVAFVQAFGHHDDIGGAVPGSMPSHAISAYQEGIIVPPVRLYQARHPNEDVIRIMTRNSRLPDSLRGDLDSEVAACRMGAERLADLFRRY